MRRALVIGNSDGIGLALTRRLLDEGWEVRGLSRSASPLSHASYSHVAGDVVTASIPSDPVDLCVYAAGVGEMLDLGDLAAQTRAIEVNLLGAARTVEAVVPAMVAAGSGHLVGLSSLADIVISADAPGYAASKAGLTAYLLGLRAALRPHGVAVTAVRFGFVDTKMAKGAAKPLMISVNEAVEVLMRGIRRRPAVISYPRRVSAAARLIRLVARTTLR
ncbi:SDR family NAD(P)-dependent oxidoreductase [Dactylosporangium sp. AC04546]|uniref:SDR family NAD(P)-dependent oxidoreductase n=1 Tax=Dactylosporangium sp. AC04546 TaxID=2862460 RepID=UPI001EDE5052|nr:SDR family NAD(P)-dependent oxidoreductase [Dactylosporangium sp. AC04546]WVK89208.1 SDR family NAD(P)-dependent oxidoreductase [Dactylosporangium sp. AC04546]